MADGPWAYAIPRTAPRHTCPNRNGAGDQLRPDCTRAERGNRGGARGGGRVVSSADWLRLVGRGPRPHGRAWGPGGPGGGPEILKSQTGSSANSCRTYEELLVRFDTAVICLEAFCHGRGGGCGGRCQQTPRWCLHRTLGPVMWTARCDHVNIQQFHEESSRITLTICCSLR